MDVPARSESLRRLTWLAGAFLFWAACILGRLISLQLVHHQNYFHLARNQQEKRVQIPAPRGSVFDRNGELLAMSVPVSSVFVNPLLLPDRAVAADILSPILGLDKNELYEKINAAYQRHRGFLWIKRKISREEANRLRSLHLEWIEFITEHQRYYPKERLAAHVLGSVDHDGNGNNGIELSLQPELCGHQGAALLLTDVQNRGIDSQITMPAQAGKSIRLTIDERIQFIAERELQSAVIANHCRTGSLVVMNPYNGEVLAMANYPSFDPNVAPSPRDDPAARFNLAVSVPFEPGSVFKVITLSAALETTNLRPGTIINCGNGKIKLFGRVIHDTHAYSALPMELVLAKSSNIGAIQIGLRVGEQRLNEYIRRLGFARKTGIPLPAESSGVVRRLERWGKTSIGSVAMGHEVSVTTLQLAQACSVIANGGFLVKPKLLLEKRNRGLSSERDEKAVPVLKPETAITMRRMMEGVVLHGTGTAARLKGYSSGGKTGTAQIYDFASRHYTHQYNASFMGFAPAPKPALVAVVTLNGASKYGGAVAAPVFRAVMMEALRMFDVPKDLPEDIPGIRENPAAMDDLAIAELSAPPVEESEPARASVDAPAGPKVPDFQGKSMRAVLEQAASLGLPVLLDGTGIVRGQEPAAGRTLAPGEPIRVRLAR